MEWKVFKIWESDCWIIGGGTSIAKQFKVPEKLIPEERNEFIEFGKYLSPLHNKKVIGINLAAFLGSWVDVAFWGDSKVYNEFKSWFDDFSGLKVSCNGKFHSNRYRTIMNLYRDVTCPLTKDRSAVSWNAKNSGTAAINLAYHLGAKRVFLLGFDMYNNKEGRSHWHSGYPDKTKTPTKAQLKKGAKIPRFDIKDTEKVFKRHMRNLEALESASKKFGLKIYNVNPNSRIDVFEKINLEDALKI